MRVLRRINMILNFIEKKKFQLYFIYFKGIEIVREEKEEKERNRVKRSSNKDLYDYYRQLV